MPAENPAENTGSDLLTRLRAESARQQAGRRAEQARAAHTAHIIALLRQGTIESTAAFEIEAEAATPADVDELLDRRRQLTIAMRFVEAARQKRAGMLGPVAGFRRLVAQEGGLLEVDGYGRDDILARLCSPHWVISHARGCVIDPQSGSLRPSTWAADVQIELPDDLAIEPLMFVPDPQTQRDAFFPQQRELAERVAAEIRTEPACAAVLSDVGVAPFQPGTSPALAHPIADYRGKKFASAATNHALGRIGTDINPGRHHPVRYLIANMFSVPSVVLPDGEEVRFDSPIINDVSVMVHSIGNEARECFLAWETPGSKIAVADGSVINANWLTAVRILRRS